MIVLFIVTHDSITKFTAENPNTKTRTNFCRNSEFQPGISKQPHELQLNLESHKIERLHH